MLTPTVLSRPLLIRRFLCPGHTLIRYLATSASEKTNVRPTTPSPTRGELPEDESKEGTTSTWLTRTVRSSPIARGVFLGISKLLGYGSSRQIAARRAFGMYEKICTVRADEDSEFWREACHLPPTFQSWFTITNFHVWLLTVRLRALAPPYGDAYIQALIDHFFIDVEDRIRAVLQPSPHPRAAPYTPISHFYTNPNASAGSDQPKPRGRAPDRLVTRQMRIFKEQWTGMGMAFDLGLVKGDMEMAGAIWRNLLGARGARGIIYEMPTSQAKSMTATSHNTPTLFRRSVNLVGGLVENPAKIDQRGLDVEEGRDDQSGVHDFPPNEADKYVAYPEVMVHVASYVRRELQRLERIPDNEVIRGDVMTLKFGTIRLR